VCTNKGAKQSKYVFQILAVESAGHRVMDFIIRQFAGRDLCLKSGGVQFSSLSSPFSPPSSLHPRPSPFVLSFLHCIFPHHLATRALFLSLCFGSGGIAPGKIFDMPDACMWVLQCFDYKNHAPKCTWFSVCKFRI
jgi:hypothetical protein